MVLSEVECLMMMFGSGASTCATKFGVDVSRFNEVTTTTVPAETSRVPETGPRSVSSVVCHAIFSPPLCSGGLIWKRLYGYRTEAPALEEVRKVVALGVDVFLKAYGTKKLCRTWPTFDTQDHDAIAALRPQVPLADGFRRKSKTGAHEGSHMRIGLGCDDFELLGE